MTIVGPKLSKDFFKQYFSTLKEPRRILKGNVIYSFDEILFLTISAIISGCNTWIAIGEEGASLIRCLWSVIERKGYLTLKTGRIDASFLLTRNTLTQRTIGSVCRGSVSLDVLKMKDGDFAGLGLL